MEVANIYDNGPISPICRIKDNLAIWSELKWMPFLVEYIEPIPRSRPFVVDTIALANLLAIPANGTVPTQLVPALQMASNELLHARWEPLDDVEGLLFELAQMARFAARGGQARVSLFTKLYDPWLATTTFWVLGGERKDAQFQTINPHPVPVYLARFAFFGYRYILLPLATMPQNVTYLPAQGR